MPKTQKLADILRATKGDIRRKTIERKCGFGYAGVRRAVKRLDSLGLTAKMPPEGRRVLAVSLEAALATVGDEHVITHADRKDKGVARRIAANDVMRLLHDPDGTFSVARGASWATSQVLPPYPYEPDEDEAEGKDEWAVGTRFQRIIDGEPQGIYEYDGEAVVEVEG